MDPTVILWVSLLVFLKRWHTLFVVVVCFVLMSIKIAAFDFCLSLFFEVYVANIGEVWGHCAVRQGCRPICQGY